MATDPFRSMSNVSSVAPGSSRLSSHGSMDSDDTDNNNNNNASSSNGLVNNNGGAAVFRRSCGPLATTMIQVNVVCDSKECDNRQATGGGGGPLKKCGRCQSVYYCSVRCQREAYLDHKPYCFDLLERQRDFFRHGAVDGNPYNHKVIAAVDDAPSSTATSSTDAPLSFDDDDEANESPVEGTMRRAKALLDNAKHATLFSHEKEKLQLQAIALLERHPLPPTTVSIIPTSLEKSFRTAVQVRVLLAQVYFARHRQQQGNDGNDDDDDENISNRLANKDKAKRALLQAIRCEVERKESSSSSNVIDQQTRDKALESIQRNTSSLDEDVIDGASMILCEELLLSKAVNNTANFGEFYAKILLLWAQVLEAECDWERALATYGSLTLLYQQLLEETEEREQQQLRAATTTTTTSTTSNSSNMSANTIKDAIATVMRGTSRCRLQFDDDDAISSLLPARQAIDTYRLAAGGHEYLAKTLEAQSNKEELLQEAFGVVQRGVLFEAPWDEQNQSDNMEQVAYFKEEIRQAEIRRLKEQDFMNLWGNVLHASETEAFKNARKTWSYTRHRIDMHGVDSDDDDDDDDDNEQVSNGNLRQATEQRLRAAASSALTTATTTAAASVATAAASAPNVEEQSAAAAPVKEQPAVITTAIPSPAEQQPVEAAAAALPEAELALRADAPSFVPRADAPSFVPGFGFTAPLSSHPAPPVIAEAPAASAASVNVDTSIITAVSSAPAPAPVSETTSAPAPETTAAPAQESVAGETTAASAYATTAEIVDGEEFHDTAQQEEDEKPIVLDGNEDFVDDSIDYANFSKILLTRDTLKWLDGADGRFRDLFIKKLRKLASGQRGYTMQKILKGSQSRIYETYLENKSGHRILWMPAENNHEGVIIYYVVAHKKVSRYMDLIDDASSRLARPVTSLASDIPEIAREAAAAAAAGGRAENSDTGHILLDPKRDIPLKLYEVDFSEIDKLHFESWRPSLHLTPKEREIVETEGTVCVLGRSGTGKTVVVASRIDYDRNLGGNNPNFSQLFVARSERICDYVHRAVGEDMESTSRLEYMTYNMLLSECEKELAILREFDNKKRVDFNEYIKGQLYDKDCKLDPLVAWTQIRSFIKSSIEAVNKGQPLTREEYLSLGAKQCRLAPAQRELAYNAFEFYQKNIGQRWDDTDRVAAIIRALRKSNETQFKLRRTKLYVDEVQDYTQAEVAMFFLLCSPKGLFLAGDPAQSVEEGVDFRFEDIRVVADNLFKNDRRNIPDKPTMLKVNFRSHAGVLNLAAGVLDQLFAAFPGSAKELPKDEGLFLGPRPAVFGGITDRSLVELVHKQEGIVILTMNEKKCEELEELLAGEEKYDLLTIRDCKGLEFDTVLLVDFFKDLSLENQKSWKKLLLEDDKSGIKESTPELEGHLKQLYTAITRCCKRMMFAETGRSVAFDAFLKWAKIRRTEELRLVDEQKVAKVDQIVLTRDEWNKKGVDWAFFAEENRDIRKSKRYMEKAVTYFRNGEIVEFLEHATTHLASIDVRIEWQELEDGAGLDASSMDETELSELMLKLIEAGLLLEAGRLCRALLRVMDDDHAYSRTNLAQRLLPLLPDIDY